MVSMQQGLAGKWAVVEHFRGEEVRCPVVKDSYEAAEIEKAHCERLFDPDKVWEDGLWVEIRPADEATHLF